MPTLYEVEPFKLTPPRRPLKAIWADIHAARRIKDDAEYERAIEPLIEELWATEDALGVAGKDPRTR